MAGIADQLHQLIHFEMFGVNPSFTDALAASAERHAAMAGVRSKKAEIPDALEDLEVAEHW